MRHLDLSGWRFVLLLLSGPDAPLRDLLTLDTDPQQSLRIELIDLIQRIYEFKRFERN